MYKLRILIIDEDAAFNNPPESMLALQEHIDSKIFDSSTAVDMLKKLPIEIVLLDSRLNPLGDNDFLKQIKEEFPAIKIIALSSLPDTRGRIQVLKNGMEGNILKDTNIGKLLLLLNELCAREPAVTDKSFSSEVKSTASIFGLENIIGHSKILHAAVRISEKVAPTNAIILLQGETGTGKELFAEAIHKSSLRRNKPFMALNCATFNKEILESELFGYVAGAFTGAVKDKTGLLEEVNGGTLFLDEIAEMNLEVQAKLLRVLEMSELIRLGDTKVTKIDFRLISATHKNLASEVKENRFRQDLFYRINMFSILLPSLRERREDILLLANYFVEIFSTKMDKQISGMTKEYESLLENYYWKGNIRELKNVIERSVILADTNILSEDVLPYEILSYVPAAELTKSTSLSLSMFEKQHIQKVLITTCWNKIEAARLLNISVSTLYRKIEDYMLSANA